MNRLRALFGSGAAGTDGFSINFEQSVADLDVDVRPVVEDGADGDVWLLFRSADDGTRAELSVQLDDECVRALAADLDETVSPPKPRPDGSGDTAE
jgi:hypothetical protein